MSATSTDVVSGLLIVDKPQGITSHDVVSRTRRLAHTRRVGHAGTLDPMATGVLVLGINKATRLLTWITDHSKRYEAQVRFGVETTTEDAEGEVTSAKGCDGLGNEEIEAVLSRFRGTISQVPSAVSAIKVNGKRAYACWGGRETRASRSGNFPTGGTRTASLSPGGIRFGGQECSRQLC